MLNLSPFPRARGRQLPLNVERRRGGKKEFVRPVVGDRKRLKVVQFSVASSGVLC